MPTSGSSNVSAFDLNLSQNDVHIRQCRNKNQTFGLTARFCCGYADEKAQCCGTPDALFELSAVSSSANSPVALNPADGSPKPWNPDSSPSSSSGPCSMSPTSGSISSSATPKTPLIVATSSTSSEQATTAAPGGSDSSIPSTDPPSSVSSPTASASSTPASSLPTTPTIAAAASAVATALADSTGAGSSLGKSGKSADSISDSPSDSDSWSSKDSSSRLSTGAIAGIGFGVSMAAAGLVTISVYFLARRRLYMKQKRKWEEQMKATGADGPGAGGPPMVAVQTQTADGKPAVVMLAGGQTVSPMSLRDLKNMRWDTQSVSEFGELESKRLSASTTRSNGTIGQEIVVKKPVDPRGERTATWFARHSIYEMG